MRRIVAVLSAAALTFTAGAAWAHPRKASAPKASAAMAKSDAGYRDVVCVGAGPAYGRAAWGDPDLAIRSSLLREYSGAGAYFGKLRPGATHCEGVRAP